MGAAETGSAGAGGAITREQIQVLMNDASEMCDVLQVAVCELALGRPVSPEARGQLSGVERAKLGRLTQQAAWAECERAIGGQ
jgi:hypothetical protein